MTTLSDLVNETFRRLMPAQLDLSGELNGDVTATAQVFTLAGPMVATAVSPGMRVSCGLEVAYVTAFNRSTLQATVVRGFDGSTPAAHTSGSIVWLNPKFTAFDISGAINEELDELAGPTALFQVKTVTITYNPVFIGYDFPAPANYYDVLAVRYKIAPPTHNYPPIKNWAVLPYMTDPTYPSGRAIIIYDSGWPGLPIHVWCACGFTHLSAATQTVQAVSGFPRSANDILPIGAAIRLVVGREIKRNFMEAQPDPRKAPEVPPGAVMNSVKGLYTLYVRRVNTEKGKLLRDVGTLRVRR